MTTSEIRALFAVASRPEVVSLAGGMPAVTALPLDAVGSMIGAFAGAFAGALVAEYTREANAATATRVATGAVLGFGGAGLVCAAMQARPAVESAPPPLPASRGQIR